LIRLSGLEEGKDIDIVYTGLRPGDKLFEELFLESEAYLQTKNAKIFVAQTQPGSIEQLDGLIAAARENRRIEIRRLLRLTVPEYCPFVEDQTAVANVSSAQPLATNLPHVVLHSSD
jgi:FlaA1/EpsC-like NDP-sugar epimerase